MPRLRIASLSVDLEGAGAPLGDLEAFLDPSGPAALRLAWEPQAGLVLPEWRGEAAFEDLSGGCVRFRRSDFEGVLDPSSGAGRLRTTRSPESLRAALRFVLALGLQARDGLLLHSAGMVRDGRAYVLSGPSGAGKSTAARLSGSGVRLLTDELCALVRLPEGWTAFGTPFRGELPQGSPAGAPLAAVALLEQSEAASAEPASRPEALRRLYPQVFRPSRDPARAAAWLALLDRLASERPVLRLRFRKDPGFWTPLLERAA